MHARVVGAAKPHGLGARTHVLPEVFRSGCGGGSGYKDSQHERR